MEIDGLVLNLIDSPGHVDFSSEVTAALRLTDGALVVVDVASGVKVQTRTVLRQALQEGVRPVLVLNKIDRLVLELQFSEEEIFTRCSSIVEEVNGIIATYSVGTPVVLNPLNGSVVFAAGKSGWGFTLPQIAARYATLTGTSEKAVLNTLWGDVFYDEANKRWSRTNKGPRGFALRVARLLIASLRKEYPDAEAALTVLGGQRNQLPQQLPLADALVTCIRQHLPSPIEAQKYRADLLYTGPRGDAVHAGIQACDPNGPLVVYIAKMTPDTNFFWAFGRVLSGTVRRNHKVIVLGPNYDAQVAATAAAEGAATTNSNDLHKATVHSVASPLGVAWKQLDSCPAGCLIALQGIDKVISKTGTVMDAEQQKGTIPHPIKPMKFTVTPIVAYSVRPKNGSDLPAFNVGLQKLAKQDSLVQIRFDELTKETLIVGSGELHLEVLLGDLKQLAKGIDLVIGKPSVSLRETIVATGPVSLAKSSNKHNRAFVVASPLPEHVLKEMDANESSGTGAKAALDKKVWCAGYSVQEQAECGPNMLVDETRAVDYLSESKGPFIDSFKRWSQTGPLCGEQVRGVQLALTDAKLHADRVHRGAGELEQMARRAYSGALLQAEPRLMEPMLRISIEAPSNMAGLLYGFVAQRRGVVVQEEPREGLPLSIITAIVPALESFGLDAALREATSGEGFPSAEFDHWAVIESNPLVDGTLANKLMRETRARKNMKAVPDLSEYIDKL